MKGSISIILFNSYYLNELLPSRPNNPTQVLGCAEADVYPALDEFLGKLIELKPLREYGMTEDQVATFAKSTVDNQQRLLGNNYVPLTEEEIAEIFQNLY